MSRLLDEVVDDDIWDALEGEKGKDKSKTSEKDQSKVDPTSDASVSFSSPSPSSSSSITTGAVSTLDDSTLDVNLDLDGI